uniref:Ion_trans_2 domain-containing protein n=1 Tax=Bursaphelenchus xylophilus TaxID=6326 RepID=A0A1I7SEK4_BURXY
MFGLTFTVKYVRPSRPICFSIVGLLSLMSTSFFITALVIKFQDEVDQDVIDQFGDILSPRSFESVPNTTNIIRRSSLYKIVGYYADTFMTYIAACRRFAALTAPNEQVEN